MTTAKPSAGELADAVFERCKTVLGNMALENEGAIFNRWPINHEPLRGDARNLLPEIERAQAALRAQPVAGADDGVDRTNHHNALKCPYCNPEGLAFAPPSVRLVERETIARIIDPNAAWGKLVETGSDANMQILLALEKADALLSAEQPLATVEREALKEATREQHFDLPKGEPARFVRNGVLETCQCRDCSALAHQPRSEGSKP